MLFPSLRVASFTMLDIIHFFISLLFPATIWLFFKAYYNKTVEFKKDHISFLSFKRNPEIFKFLLLQNGYVKIAWNKESLILGNPNAPITITAFLSLYCNPCSDAFKKLKVLLDNCPDVKINAIFSVYKDEESQKLIDYLYFLYKQEGSDITKEFLYKWYSTDKKLRKPLYEKVLPDEYKLADEVGKTNKVLFDKYKVAGTPTVYVQGYKFPTQFDYKDIEFYIEDIKKLNLESKRQEACAN